MSSCNPVTMVSEKREDISYSDMGCKHGKPAEVFRFCLFMKHYRNIIQSNEEQNPLAVMRWPENDSFLLEQLKNWIEKKLSGFNALKIISSLRQEPIYRSPGAGQQTAVTRYSICIQIENRDAFYQGASRPQMLLWDAHVPPPKRATSGGDWYIVSMEVFVDKTDLGGRRLDNRNPEVHVKVTLHVADGRRAWTPPVVNPCLMNYNLDYTLSPEEFCQLVGPQQYLPNEQSQDPIPTLNSCVLKYHVDYTLSPEEMCQFIRRQKYFLPNKQPQDPIPKGTSTLDPGPPKLNHAIHVDRRNMNVNRWSSYKSGDTGDSAFQRFKAISILLLLAKVSPAAAYPVQQSHQVEIEIPRDKLNCTLKMDNRGLCYGHCGQIGKQIVQGLVRDFCQHQQQNAMNKNLLYLEGIRNVSSGTLQLNLIWNRNKDFNATNVTIQYIFNGKELTEKEMANLPMTISDPQKDDIHLNISAFLEKMKDYVKNLWGRFREEFLPFLQNSNLPETTTSLPTTETTASNTETTAPWIIAISIILVSIIPILIIIGLFRKYGKMTCKTVRDIISNISYGLVAQTEAEAGTQAQSK